MPAEKRVRNNIFGNVSITWSEPMTADEVADLEQLLEIWMRGIKRRAAEDVTETTSE